MRPTFEEAKRIYIHRFTAEHVPTWARQPMTETRYYAPQYRNDREWYNKTTFPGEDGHLGGRDHCFSSGQTWPFGQSLPAPYRP